MMKPIPLTRPEIDEETIAGVAEVLRSGWITSGPKVKEFEAALSFLMGGRIVRAFVSATAAMEVALRMAGVGPGDEVITTPLTWVATSNVVLQVGARPVFVDVDRNTRNIDLDKVEAAVTPRTRALLPVDLAGLVVDRDRLYAIAAAHRLRVIEDAAQSLGSRWQDRLVGSFGDLTSFSFHPNKNITSIEGGCLVMDTEEQARLAEQWRLQGVVRSGFDGMEVEVPGLKSNLTDVAARVGIGQLPHLQRFNEARAALARLYFKAFANNAVLRQMGVELPQQNFSNTNWHMFQVVLPETQLRAPRAEVMKLMHDEGIATGVHYPVIHLFALYRKLGWQPGQFPQAEYLGRNMLTLPMFPALQAEDVERIVNTLAMALERCAR